MVIIMMSLYCGRDLENLNPNRDNKNDYTKELAMGNIWRLAKDHVAKDDEASYDAYIDGVDEFLQKYPAMMSFINEVNNFVRNSFRTEKDIEVKETEETKTITETKDTTINNDADAFTSFWTIFNNFKKNPTDNDFNKLCTLLKSLRANNEISCEDCNSMLIAINNVLENC